MLNAHVVYATITGNNEAVADIIVSLLHANGVNVKKTEISQTEVEEFLESDIAIVVPYTYDSGSLPDEGLDFFEDLAHMNLSAVVYGVAGSGDTYYMDDFAIAVPKFEEQFAKTGAIKGAEGVKINLYPDADAEEKLSDFVQSLIKTTKNR